MIGAEGGGYVEVPEPVHASVKERRAPESFADHFTQPRMFWLSMSPVEQEQISSAHT